MERRRERREKRGKKSKKSREDEKKDHKHKKRKTSPVQLSKVCCALLSMWHVQLTLRLIAINIGC